MAESSNSIESKRKDLIHAVENTLTEKGISGSTSIFEKCASLCEQYSISVEDLGDKADAFTMNDGSRALTSEKMGKFEGEIREHMSRLSRSKNQKREMATPIKMESNKKSAPSPASQRVIPMSHDSNAARIDQGKNMIVFQEENMRPFQDFLSVDGRANSISLAEDAMPALLEPYRHMFCSSDDHLMALESHFMDIQESLCNLVGISMVYDSDADPSSYLTPVGVPNQHVVWVCGSILCDTVEGKINSTSVLLEGNWKDSKNRRVYLSFPDTLTFSVFPGQIVLVKGIFSGGSRMAVHGIIEGCPPPKAMSSPSRLLRDYYGSINSASWSSTDEAAPVRMMVAAGPFTLQDNLDYEPMDRLIRNVLISCPDVVVLIGPFVDIQHPLIKEGIPRISLHEGDQESSIATYDALFVAKIVRDAFQAYFNSASNRSLRTKFVLIPSLLDANHDFVFPQPPFPKSIDPQVVSFEINSEPIEFPNSRENFTLLPNPAMFSVNEVLFGVTSNDMLLGLSSVETAQNLTIPRIERLAGHILQQHSFAPHNPPLAGSQVDARFSSFWEFQKCPDVLIIPSKMAPMAKDILGTVVINPGLASRGNGWGSFAEITILPPKKDQLVNAVDQDIKLIEHHVVSRTGIRIVKL